MEEEIIQEKGYVPKHISFSDLEEYTDYMLEKEDEVEVEEEPAKEQEIIITSSIEIEEEEEEIDPDYPITKSKAIEIARPELKKIYVSHHRDGVSGLYFTDFNVTLLGTGEEKWYKVEVTDGDISHIIESDEKTTFKDGKLTEESLKELVGYVNAKTGEFEYDEGENA